MENPELVGYRRRPPKEKIGHHTKRRSSSVNQSREDVSEGWFKRSRGDKEIADLVWRERIGVLRVGREAMVGGVEGDFKEANGGGGRKNTAEIGDVEWGVYEGDLIALLFQLKR